MNAVRRLGVTGALVVALAVVLVRRYNQFVLTSFNPSLARSRMLARPRLGRWGSSPRLKPAPVSVTFNFRPPSNRCNDTSVVFAPE